MWKNASNIRANSNVANVLSHIVDFEFFRGTDLHACRKSESNPCPFFQISISGKDHSGFPTRVKVGPSKEFEVDEIFDIVADTACDVGRRQGAASQTAVKVTAPDGTTIVIFKLFVAKNYIFC